MLVVIGLVVGGVLAGQELVKAAAARAQIAQIEKFHSAVNTFKGKYGGLPGDLGDPDATNFGFVSRGLYAGQPGFGDNNGILEGSCGSGCHGPYKPVTGETEMLWVDLSTAHLIGESFSSTAWPIGIPVVTGAGIANYLPPAKIGQGNYVYAYNFNGFNYFGLSSPSSIGNLVWALMSSPGLTPQQASLIDTKADDGLPQNGNIIALYVNNNLENYAFWAAGGGAEGAYTTAATPASATTCFDNGGVANVTQRYSVTGNNNMNCAISFRFQ